VDRFARRAKKALRAKTCPALHAKINRFAKHPNQIYNFSPWSGRRGRLYRPDEVEVLLLPILRQKLKDVNPGVITDDVRADVILTKLRAIRDNAEWISWLRNEATYQFSADEKAHRINLIDYEELTNNYFLSTNQFWVDRGDHRIRTYVLLFVVAGVMSIYAYDARLSDPSTELELISFIPPQPDRVIPEPVRVRHNDPPPGAAQGPRSERPVLIDRADNPLNPPKGVSAVASPFPPAHAGTVVGPLVLEPSGSGPANDGSDSGSNTPGNVLVVSTPDPPPAPTPAPSPKRVITSPRVLNGLALSLPKPAYPPIAKQAGVQGSVNVQVLIDESGKVVSAKPISGSPLLMHAAQQAAMGARFSPTMLGEQAVKVSGVIIYNFILQ